jgi:hypothetical protein
MLVKSVTIGERSNEMAVVHGVIELSERRLRLLSAEPASGSAEAQLIHHEVDLAEGLDSLPEVLDGLVESGLLTPGRWLLALSGDQVSAHRLTSPLKDPRKVRLTLEFELENALPFRSDEVVVAHQLRRLDDGTEILAVATSRRRLETILSALQERRVEAVMVVPAVFGAVPVAAR